MTRLLAAAALLGLLLTAPASAQVADTAPFLAACTAAGPEAFGLSTAEQSAAACGCIAADLSARPQADLDILAADLKGESTAETRAAHGSYEAVEEAARDSVGKCLAEVTGVAAPDAPDPNRVAPDMAGFDANCRASARLKDYLAGAPKGADAALDAACSCVSTALAAKFSQPVVDFLGEQLASADPGAAAATATPEQEEAGQAAEQVMGQCIASATAG